MTWDCFCPECKAVIVGSMSDDPEDMEREMNRYLGQILTCPLCESRIDFNSGEIVYDERRDE